MTITIEFSQVLVLIYTCWICRDATRITVEKMPVSQQDSFWGKHVSWWCGYIVAVIAFYMAYGITELVRRGIDIVWDMIKWL